MDINPGSAISCGVRDMILFVKSVDGASTRAHSSGTLGRAVLLGSGRVDDLPFDVTWGGTLANSRGTPCSFMRFGATYIGGTPNGDPTQQTYWLQIVRKAAENCTEVLFSCRADEDLTEKFISTSATLDPSAVDVAVMYRFQRLGELPTVRALEDLITHSTTGLRYHARIVRLFLDAAESAGVTEGLFIPCTLNIEGDIVSGVLKTGRIEANGTGLCRLFLSRAVSRDMLVGKGVVQTTSWSRDGRESVFELSMASVLSVYEPHTAIEGVND